MTIANPAELVDEFKKSGEFDRLRRELLAQFRSGEGMAPFMARVDDIARQKLTSDQRLHYMPEAAVNRELMQELDRYPIVERAVSDVRLLSDPTFAASIRESVNKILMEDRNKSENPAEKVEKQAENIETSDSQVDNAGKPLDSSNSILPVDTQAQESAPNQVEDMETDQPQHEPALAKEQTIAVEAAQSQAQPVPLNEDGLQPMQL